MIERLLDVVGRCCSSWTLPPVPDGAIAAVVPPEATGGMVGGEERGEEAWRGLSCSRLSFACLEASEEGK